MSDKGSDLEEVSVIEHLASMLCLEDARSRQTLKINARRRISSARIPLGPSGAQHEKTRSKFLETLSQGEDRGQLCFEGNSSSAD